jgi:hypothetical protein
MSNCGDCANDWVRKRQDSLTLVMRPLLRPYAYFGCCVCIAHESFKSHLLYGNRSVLPIGPFFSLGLVFEDSVAGSFTVRVGDYDPNVLMLALRFLLTHGHE